MSADLDFTITLARTAGAIARAHYGRVERETKRGDEAVTTADRACQRHIVSALAERFPEDGIIGEENDDGRAITHVRPRSGYRTWVIDPIDGTNNFVAGLGNFAVCIGRLDAGFPALGVVYDVCRDEVYAAERGAGAWLDGTRIAALTTPLSERSLMMLTSNLLDAHGRLPAYALRFHAQTRLKIRVLGSAALEAVQVGAGVAHGALTLNGKLWDVAAAAAVVMESGGALTDLHGAPIFPFEVEGYTGGKVPFLAAAPGAAAELLSEIARH